MTQPFLQTIYRFPVKGFPGEALASTSIEKGHGIPLDRRYAITNGTEDTGEWMPARSFFINAVNDGMSKHRLEHEAGKIYLTNVNGMELLIEPDKPDSLVKANAILAEFMGPVGIRDDLLPPRIVERNSATANWDYIDTPVSIINAETVRAVSAKLGVELDPLRFRGNLVIDGLPAWEEFSWMGKRIVIGGVKLDVHRPIDRCPTPGVNPATGERDVEVTPGLNNHYGHVYCGMYAKVAAGGTIKKGDAITVIGDSDIKLEDAFVSNASPYERWPRTVTITGCDIGDTTTVSLKAIGPWPLPQAKPGQRLRLHLGDIGWTTEYISAVTDDTVSIEITDSETGDPITEHLRKGLDVGSTIVISGPYGRV